MALLSEFAYLPIDWQMTPEHAVTMYLEWGNNDWHSEYPPVRSKEDYSIYFVVDTWGEKPVVRLVKRNSEQADDLISLELPANLQAAWQAEYPGLRGIFEPTDEIKNWLKQELNASGGQ